jgi:hypothetical protein
MIQHDLQVVYIFGLLQCVFSTASLLSAYSRKWGSHGIRKTTLTPKIPCVFLPNFAVFDIVGKINFSKN